MRAGDFLAAAAELPVRDLEAFSGGGGIVVVAPHPDDEALGCGGLIAEACARGVDLRLVVVSDGVGSHPNSASYPPSRLRALREQETLRAASAVGLRPGAVSFLRLPDRHVPAQGPAAERAAGHIAAEAAACGAGAIFVTWEHDPHCDHTAACRIARLARRRLREPRLYAFSVWGWRTPSDLQVSPDEPRGGRLDVAAHLPSKKAAILAHASQTTDLIGDDPDGFRLGDDMVARCTAPYEVFFEVRP